MDQIVDNIASILFLGSVVFTRFGLMCCRSLSCDAQDSTCESDLHLPYKATQARPRAGEVPDQVRFVYESTLTAENSLNRARAFTALQNQRRSVRFYDSKPFPVELLMECIKTAGTGEHLVCDMLDSLAECVCVQHLLGRINNHGILVW